MGNEEKEEHTTERKKAEEKLTRLKLEKKWNKRQTMRRLSSSRDRDLHQVICNVEDITINVAHREEENEIQVYTASQSDHKCLLVLQLKKAVGTGLL